MLLTNKEPVQAKNEASLVLPTVSLHGMDLAKEVLDKMASSNKPALVYVDPDVDGFFAAKFIMQALKERGIPFSWYINPNREHGFLLDPKKVEGFNVINGDFEIPPEVLENLVSRGCNVLSMDHHASPTCSEVISFRKGEALGVTINNQYTFENPDQHFLSGAQVTLETLRSCGITQLSSLENDALAAITLLSDVRDIENEQAKAQLSLLYNWKYKGEIKRLISGVMGSKKDYGYGLPRMDREFVDFSFSPAINSLIRLNREEEAFKFILGGSYPDDTPTPQMQQREMVLELLEKAIKVETTSLIFVKLDARDLDYKFLPLLSNMLGLVCSRLTDGGKNVLGFVTDLTGKVERASFRGVHPGLSYRSSLLDLLDARGHEIAFGIKNFQPSAELFSELARRIADLEQNYSEPVSYKEVKNLKLFLEKQGGKDLAKENAFLLSQSQRYIKYTGSLVSFDRGNEKYSKWLVDGYPVLQFDMSLDIKKDLILPTWSRKELGLVLSKKFPG